jgi:hypothetical protein
LSLTQKLDKKGYFANVSTDTLPIENFTASGIIKFFAERTRTKLKIERISFATKTLSR